MDSLRRDFMRLVGAGLAGTALADPRNSHAQAPSAPPQSAAFFDVRQFGATGEGGTVDTPAINKAIEAAAAAGGGTTAQAALNSAEEEKSTLTRGCSADMPTQGLFARHVKNLEIADLHLEAASPDARAGLKFHEIDGLDLFRIRAELGTSGTKVILDNVKRCEIAHCASIDDVKLANVDQKTLG
jgi:hypothetical protein